MVKSCCAVDCHRKFKKGSGISFYKFPSDPSRRARWIAAVRWESWSPNGSTLICSEHFASGKKSENPLSPDYIPTLFNYTKSPVRRKVLAEVENFERRQAMKRRRIHDTPALAPVSENQVDEDTTVANSSSSAVHALTDEAFVERAKEDLEKRQLQMRRLELEKRLKEVTDEKEALQKAYDDLKSRTSYKADVMMHDDKKVKYYTGLPSFSMLKAIYDYVSTDLPTCMQGAKLDVFEQLMLVLI